MLASLQRMTEICIFKTFGLGDPLKCKTGINIDTQCHRYNEPGQWDHLNPQKRCLYVTQRMKGVETWTCHDWPVDVR